MDKNIAIGWVGVFLCILNIIFITTLTFFAVPFWIYIAYKTLIKNQKLQKWTWIPVGFMIFLQILVPVTFILAAYYLA